MNIKHQSKIWAISSTLSLTLMALALALTGEFNLLKPLANGFSKPAYAQEEKQCDREPTDMTVYYDDRIVCTTEGRGDTDIFRLQATARDRIIFSVSGRSQRNFEVIDPSGNSLGKDSDYGIVFEATLKQTGIYTFIISPHSGQGSMGRFPYSVIYQIQEEDRILIVAVMHWQCKPHYWENRL
ncbi:MULTISPECIES: hypothetical protein [unclassified Roseofilum]|uniref:hypothetical protein n=1 Tax=unclassified Roseofilum TaxID=2620099 RepID=UPI000E9A2382|nr:MULTISPECIES: hypothetical protein [unclassified Roseofilum]MBP0007925.1 type II toxin-antitoxin system RelE/ParE family toxin [Roseofilum sp. Belize Diploria]MBP0032332.1 type II toxin-antitoxin system RelE/ParE family toxin [Roseofilum sp. Belize BBD 4]HBQ97483.1 hypothetical protein [Cyanobacteria bacterium UBA11691]